MNPRRAFAKLFPFLVLALTAWMLPGCVERPSSGRVLVLGFDGVDPDVVELLISEGKLPHFETLRSEGAFGRLLSAKPLLSPVIWTTIATGKTPDQHRIGDFVAINPSTGDRMPVTSRMRKSKALWNIFTDADRSVSVVGWWATWPAETVHGTIVSDHLCYHFLFEEGFTEDRETIGLTFPPELVDVLAPMVRRPGDLTPEETAAFVDVELDEFDRPFDFNDHLSHFKWALATAETYRQVGLHLWERDRPDLMMAYFEATDSTSHLFGHLFRREGLSGELAEQQARFGNAVEKMYVRADEILGDFLETLEDDTTLVVLSDHGFRLGALPDDPSKTRDMRRVSERYHLMEGILYLYGRGVAPGAHLDEPSIIDVAPTILALAGLPPARDMPGRVLAEALQSNPREAVPTYESDVPEASEVAEGSPVDPRILEKLESLGYLGDSSRGGDRNLAAVLFQQGRHEEAAELYEKLVQEDPKDAAARASLAGALGALGRYDEALGHLEMAIELDPLNPEAYHNRGVVHEKQGEHEAAIREYRTALRYNPRYEPSRQALLRLTGSANTGPAPTTDAERRAVVLARQSAELARRGDYDEAMARLDEAERIAPTYALIQQYRSNVAYLMGDRDAAVAALEKGLELEPDNALFRKNLERLQDSKR
jgi:predicted AlkP superfamily phosphohydrolase/phosphomutase/Flp pilus assembly protein TadD